MISLPYKGKQEENVSRSPRNTLDKILQHDVIPKFVYTGTKLSAKFQIKNKTKDEHKNDLLNVQNVMKVKQQKQEEDCKIGLMNIREKIVSITF